MNRMIKNPKPAGIQGNVPDRIQLTRMSFDKNAMTRKKPDKRCSAVEFLFNSSQLQNEEMLKEKEYEGKYHDM